MIDLLVCSRYSFNGVKTSGDKELSESPKPTPATIRERNITVTSYYNQQAIDRYFQHAHFFKIPGVSFYWGHASSVLQGDLLKLLVLSTEKHTKKLITYLS